MGECVAGSAPARDGGVTDASTTDGSVRVDGSVVRDASVSDADDTPIALAPSRRGCQCATPGAAPSSRGAAFGLALGALLLARRSRRRRA